MYGYVYLTTNLYDNNKKYIGLHKYSGETIDENYFGSGRIIRDWIKYFRKNHIKLSEAFSVSVLEFCDTPESLSNAEIKWIRYFNALEDENFYNIAYGGSNNPGHKLSEVERKQRSEALSNRNCENWKNPDYRKSLIEVLTQNGYNTHHSIETRKKMSESRKGLLKGRKMSDVARQKMSEAKKLHPSPTMTSEGNPMCNRKWMYNSFESIAVKEEDFDHYLSLGYQFGRKSVRRKWIHNNEETKCVPIDELDLFLNNGWELGRIL